MHEQCKKTPSYSSGFFSRNYVSFAHKALQVTIFFLALLHFNAMCLSCFGFQVALNVRQSVETFFNS